MCGCEAVLAESTLSALPPGTVVPTPSGWTWTTTPPPATTTVTLDPETLWRLCTRGISYEHAMTAAHIDGDHALAAAALTITSIIH